MQCHCGIVISCILMAGLIALGGCHSTTKTYDVSGIEPFTGVVGKNLPLTRNVVLVEWGTLAESAYSLVYTDELEYVKSDMHPLKTVPLPIGKDIRVDDILLVKSRQPNGFKSDKLFALVCVDNLPRGWPQQITAVLKLSTPQIQTSWIEPFSGTIRAAPWEPLDTPPSRGFDTRDARLLKVEHN